MAEEILAGDDLIFPGPGALGAATVGAAVAAAIGAGGHVAAAVAGAGAAAGAPDAAGAGAAAGDGAAAQQRAAMRWTDAMSGFVLRRFCQLITTGVRTDKGFKEVHLNQVAQAVHEFSGNEVTGTQVYNHLRKWRQKWIKISKLRDLSGALFDEDNYQILLEEEHYNGHIKVSIA